MPISWHSLSVFSTLLLLVPQYFATEFCMECRPFELQDSPGIGIHLGISDGTAAIKFLNGTLVDVAQIQGSEQYVSAMKSMAVDAQGVRKGEKSEFSRVVYHPPRPPLTLFPLFPDFFSGLFNYALQETKKMALKYRSPPVAKPPADPLVRSIAAMISSLKDSINEIHKLSYPLVTIAIPGFEADTGHIYKNRFMLATEAAGLQAFNIILLSSRAAFDFYDVQDCYGSSEEPDQGCPAPKERLNVIATVTYSEASLEVTKLTRWMGPRLWGRWWPEMVRGGLELGFGDVMREEAPVEYWEGVEGMLRLVITGDVEKIVLLGSHASDEDFQRVLRRVVKEASGKSIEDMSLRRDEGDNDETMYAVARGAATEARRAMVDGYDGCLIPNRCKRPSDGANVDSGRKSEL